MSPVISHDEKVQAAYERMVAAGESPRLAEALATRKFPGIAGTDSVFMQGRKTDGAQFDGSPPWIGKDYVKKAEAAGVSVSGKVYDPGIAKYPGDPRAWISGRSDLKAICEREGWTCRGAVNVEGREVELVAKTPYQVAPDIIAREVRDAVVANPELARDKVELAHVAREIATTRAGRGGAS